jgi:hypothetical protein
LQQGREDEVVNRDVIPKPKAWDGKGGSVETRHFLAAFNNYTQAQGDPLNTFNQPTNAWIINQTSWIQSVLNLMEGDARTWALPHLEELQHGRDPFGGIWQCNGSLTVGPTWTTLSGLQHVTGLCGH